jgi:hypothetical protein
MKLPEHNTIAAAIDAAHESKVEPPRPHMGASGLGHPCDRWLWLSFRWAVIEPFPGRILRLFRRGHAEEASVIADLRSIGVDVSASQHRVTLGGHVSGSLDGVIESGLPGAGKTRHVLEIKTHSKKSFDELEAKGVATSKPMHYTQMQVYMLGSGIDRALYYAVLKDVDLIYTERVRLDKEAAQKAVARGNRNAMSDRMPEPLSADPSWYQCKWCAAHDLCHKSKLTKQVNCRTCAHSTATEAGAWYCDRWADSIPADAQPGGCDSHVLHPDLVPWPRRESFIDWTAIYVIDGAPVMTGEDFFRSAELIANPSACASGDPVVAEIRQTFDGRVVG